MIRTIILAILTFVLIFFLNRSLTVKDNSVPALGKFLSPFHGFWQSAENVKTMSKDEILKMDLKGKATVIFDKRLVPHIFAENDQDAYKIQGYLHAKYRLWQMDISTRSAAGRLSEVLGDELVEVDKRSRRQGMLMAAENAIKGWKKFPKTYKYLAEYAEGVNDFINQLSEKDLPLEYKLMNHKPPKWTTLHSALFQKNMARTLCSGYSDVENTNLLNHFGKDVYEYLYPETFPNQSPIIPSSVEWNFEGASTQRDQNIESSNDIGHIKNHIKSDFVPGTGSNNWALSGNKTQSGKPILCGDPHLTLSLPSIWYEMQIHTPTQNVYGVSLPGMPGVIIGFNENIAWSPTNVGHDVWDYYKIKWANDEKTKYYVGEETKEVNYRYEKIETKSGKVIIDTLKMTEFGLIDKMNDEDYSDLAFDWLAHKTPEKNEIATFLGINKAKNYSDFSNALENYITPAQNFCFASRDGDIAMVVNGDLPIKDNQAGLFVNENKGSSKNWSGFIPRDQLPRVLNPERGFVSSANQHSTDSSYPYYYNSSGYFESYRGRILNEKLAKMEHATVKDMMTLQNDVESLKAREVLPLMLETVHRESLNDMGKAAYDQMVSWDYHFTPESKAASCFESWYESIYDLTFDELDSLDNHMSIRYPQDWVLIRMMTEDGDDGFFDLTSTEKKETSTQIIQMAFDKMIKEVTEKSNGKDISMWHEFKKKEIKHLSGIDAFSTIGIKTGGHGDALNAYGTRQGPSWRMIVSLDDQVSAKVIYPGGESGNIGSPHYDDAIQSWASGQYYDALFMKNENDYSDQQIMKISINPTN